MGKIIAAERFRPLAGAPEGGVGMAAANSMAFFRDRLYVGTSSSGLGGSDKPPRILRYAPEAGHWETVYESPLVDATARSHVPDLDVVAQLNGAGGSALAQPDSDGKVPRDDGYRSMCVFRASSDAEPALYVSAMSRAGGLLLRSLDGESFEPVGEPGLGNPDLYSLRSLTGFGGRLFAAPAGTVADEYLDPHLAPEPKVYVSKDPAGGAWEAACEISFGDLTNAGVSSLCAANGRLYAGTLNPDRGFQLWETLAEGEPPYAWKRVVADGAGAFNHNLAVSAMAEFRGALYVGSGVTGFGYDVVHEVGPASAELIRVHPDGSWDLIAGRMRFTRDGLKVPLSLLGPGLGDFYNAAIWALAEHEGVLYLGTHQWEALRALELNSAIVGGYQLWASENGEDWELVIDDGGGNPAEFGVAALASTPLGLLVGTQSQSGLLRLVGGDKASGLELKPGCAILLGQ